VLYWIVSNIFSIVQYIIIGSPAKAAAEAKANSSDTKKNAIDAPVRSAKKKKKKK
jgi:membrane protein insertase Oxa1/YidC/SpoIIIJ